MLVTDHPAVSPPSPTTPPAARPDRRFALALGAIALVALALRVVVLLTIATRDPDGGDPFYYHQQAVLLADGEGFAEPFAYRRTGEIVPSAIHPPLFSVVLAVPSLAGADGYLAHKLTSSLVGVGAVVVIGLLARRLARSAGIGTGARAGLLAAGLAAIAPNLWVIEGALMPESLGALTIAVVLLVAHRFLDRPTLAAAAALGASIGIAALARGEAVALVPLLGAPAVLVAVRPWRDRLRTVVVLGVAAGLVLAPWVVRNLATFERPVLLSANGDEVLRNSNCDLTWYGDQVGFWAVGCYLGDPPAGDESVRARYYRDGGLAYVGDHLDRLPVVLATRVGRVWDLYRPSQNVSLSTVEGRHPGAARFGQYLYFALLPLAAAGLVVLHRRRVSLVPVLSTAALVTLTAVYAYGVIRFRVPAEVAIIALAGVALDALVRLVAARRSPPGAPAIAGR